MPSEDAQRWDARYTNSKRYETFVSPRPFLTEHKEYLVTPGLALDLAMGLGGNAGYLIGLGWKVVGVDISEVALHNAKARMPTLMAVQADLTQFPLPEAAFDLIINFFYLERSLWPQFEAALHPNGLLMIETLTQEMRLQQPDIDPVYLLAPGELKTAFPNLEIITYEEGWKEGDTGHRKAVASLLARKSP